MPYEMSRKRLRHYFGNITYIDDQFDHCLVQEPIIAEDSDTEGPPLPTEAPSPSEDNTHEDARMLTEAERSGINLRLLLDALNDEKYDGIRLNPVIYSSSSTDERICNQIMEAPFTIVDWNLGKDKDAYSIINTLFSQTQQLKVIVVYTANFIEALKALHQDPKLSQLKGIPTKYGNFDAFLCNNKSLLVVASKQNYNVLTLLDIVTELFVDNCGIMPIALLDFMESAQKLSDTLFSDFSNPFADLYHLQMHFSELNQNDKAEAVTQFMQNKFREECCINPAIISELFLFQKNRLQKHISSSHAKEKLDRCLNSLIPHFSGEDREFCAALLTVDFSVFKSCCEQAVAHSTDWIGVINSFAPFFEAAKTKVAANRVDAVISPYIGVPLPEVIEKSADQHAASLRQKSLKDIKDSFCNFERQISPVLVQMFISEEDLIEKGIELVKNLKFKYYDDPSLSNLLLEGVGYNNKKKAEFLQNRMHFGDVLIKQDADGNNDYLLCITPPCDVFRPEKTKLHIIFIRGSEISLHELAARRKENTHLSALPSVDASGNPQIRYVNWKFFDIVTFNLKEEKDYKDLCTWERPYMMAEQYARQISNLFISYFSRAGVDELFMKSAPSLRHIFYSE